jgi:hypothetical protein
MAGLDPATQGHGPNLAKKKLTQRYEDMKPLLRQQYASHLRIFV